MPCPCAAGGRRRVGDAIAKPQRAARHSRRSTKSTGADRVAPPAPATDDGGEGEPPPKDEDDSVATTARPDVADAPTASQADRAAGRRRRAPDVSSARRHAHMSRMSGFATKEMHLVIAQRIHK